MYRNQIFYKRKGLSTMDAKKSFLSLYNQLEYDYKSIVLNTARCLATYKDIPEKGYKPYDITGVINYYQEKKGYTDQEVCDMVNELVYAKNEKSKGLDIGTYRRIQQRNSQSSKSRTNWLELIAQVLEFDPKEYHNYLSEEGLAHTQELVTTLSHNVNSINTLYDLLSIKERTAIEQLTMSLLKQCYSPVYKVELPELLEDDEKENENIQE